MTKITDRNGNHFNISYSNDLSRGVAKIVNIQAFDAGSTSANRTVNFEYDILPYGFGTRPRLARIIANPGTAEQRTWSYEYAQLNNQLGLQLTKVTRPDGRTWQYGYNIESGIGVVAPSVLNKVTHPLGGVVNFSYSERVLGILGVPPYFAVTGKTVNGALGSWVYAYTYGTGPDSTDTTTVTLPTGGSIVYKHYGFGQTCIICVGPNTVWRIGSLREKITSSNVNNAYHREVYTWDKQPISGQNDFRASPYNSIDVGSFAPILTNKTVTRGASNYITNYSGYDSYGNVASVSESTDSGSATRSTATTYHIDTAKWIVKQPKNETVTTNVVAGNYQITRAFDANGNLSSENRYGATTSYLYHANGTVASITKPGAQITNFDNTYSRGIPITERRPLGVVITREGSVSGNLTSENDGLNNPKVYGYDSLNRLTSISFPAGAYPTSAAVSITYPGNTRVLTRGGFTETTTYDGFGRALSVNHGGITSYFTYDILGRKLTESNPNAQTVTTKYDYDALDRPTRTTNPDGTYRENTYPGPAGGILAPGAPVGNTMRMRDEVGGMTYHAFRSYGNPDYRVLMSITAPEPSANVSIQRVHGLDKITAVTQNGITRSYFYGVSANCPSQEYLCSINEPETGITTFGRDANGKMTTKQVGTTGQTVFGYDGLERLQTITYPANANVANRNVSMTYFANGLLNTVNNGYATRSYVYDQTKKPRTETLTIGATSYVLDCGYDANEQLSSITYPTKPDNTRTLVDYAPNALARPTKAGAYVTGISYFANGQINTMAFANGVNMTFGQNNLRLWPTSMSVAKSLGPTYVNTAYAYGDARGNLTAISDTIFPDYNRTFGYDAINRLTTANGTWGNGTISYAGNGNISSQSLGTFNLSYVYANQNRLTSTTGSKVYTFGYDVYGNVQSNGANTFTYDDALNLRTVGGSGVSQTHEYDGKNMRVSSVSGGKTTYFMYGGAGNLLWEYTTSPQGYVANEHVYVLNQRVATRTNTNIPVSSTVSLSASATTFTYGQPVTFTATVSGYNPSGTVTFKDGNTVLGTTNVVGGVATFTTSTLGVGTRQITATYDGDGNNTTSTSAAVTETVQVSPAMIIQIINSILLDDE